MPLVLLLLLQMKVEKFIFKCAKLLNLMALKLRERTRERERERECKEKARQKIDKMYGREIITKINRLEERIC